MLHRYLDSTIEFITNKNGVIKDNVRKNKTRNLLLQIAKCNIIKKNNYREIISENEF